MMHWCLGIYFGSCRYSHVCGHNIFLNGSNRSILLCIYWKSPFQVGPGASPWLASLFLFFRKWSMYLRLLLRWGLLHWWFLNIILLYWWYCFVFFCFWVIIAGSATLIWWINKCIWCIMLLIMHEHRFISFYKPTHGLPVAGWENIYINTVGSGDGKIKCNMELWWYPSCRQAIYQG